MESDISLNQANEFQGLKADEMSNARNALRQQNIAFYQRVSTILTSSSVETIKKDNQIIQLSTQNKTDLQTIHQEHRHNNSNSLTAKQQFLELKHHTDSIGQELMNQDANANGN